MPELPDVVVYLEAMERFIGGRIIERARVASISLMRTYDPPLREVEGKRVVGFARMGKRIVWELDDDLYMVFHLMIAGRFRWRRRGAVVPQEGRPRRLRLRRRNSRPDRTGQQEAGVAPRPPRAGKLWRHTSGARVEPLETDPAGFGAALRGRNRTLKAGPRRPADAVRYRQRLLGRDPPSRPPVACEAHRSAHRGRDGPPVRVDQGGSHRMDRPDARGGR